MESVRHPSPALRRQIVFAREEAVRNGVEVIERALDRGMDPWTVAREHPRLPVQAGVEVAARALEATR